MFDNDNDDFLDAISKSPTSSDAAGDKNGPTGPPDDAPIDLVCVCVCCVDLYMCVCNLCVVNVCMYVHKCITLVHI